MAFCPRPFLNGLRNVTKKILVIAMLLCLALTVNAGSMISPGSFKFVSFDVPNSTHITLESINNFGFVVGGYTIAAGASKGFVRCPDGTIRIIVEPQDQGGDKSGATSAEGINDEGVIVGYNFNTAGGYLQGFFLYGDDFKPFVFPGQPPLSATAIFAINDLGTFGGYFQDAPSYATYTAYIHHDGKNQSFAVHSSGFSSVYAINNHGWSAGTFQDATGFYRGFVRDSNGNVTVVDVPTANTANNQGTVLLGMNDFGAVSGHFWDTTGKEHGFLGFPGGHFFKIDLPDAAITSGAGVNNSGQVTGHWTDTSGLDHGYIATPRRDDDDDR
jgi:hypothetical protein